jgi:hypothetical protein
VSSAPSRTDFFSFNLSDSYRGMDEEIEKAAALRSILKRVGVVVVVAAIVMALAVFGAVH